MTGLRAVLRDKNGFWHIMGVLTEEHEIKSHIELDMASGEHVVAKLVKVTPRLVMYREMYEQ